MRKKINAVQDSGDDTASDDSFSETDSVNFSLKAIKPARRKMPRLTSSIYALQKPGVEIANRFTGLEGDEDKDQTNFIKTQHVGENSRNQARRVAG